MTIQITRRQAVQTLGWGGATLLVGCNTTPGGTVTPATGELSTSTTTTTCAGTITLWLRLKSNATEVIKVEFYQGKTLLGTSTTAPYSVSVAADLVTRSKGGDDDDVENDHEYERYFTAKVYLKDSTVNTSNKIKVVIMKDCGTDTTPPTVSLSASSGNVTAAGKVTLTATAADNLGVSEVEFYEGATLLATKAAAPYTYDLSLVAANNGTHNYIAKAYDAAGNTTSSTPAVSVVVNIPAATTGTKVAPLTDFPSVGAWKDFEGPLGSDVGGIVYRSNAQRAGSRSTA